MARTALTVQEITRTGLTPALTAANADGHSVANEERTFLIVTNGGGGSINVTVQTPGTVDTLAVSDLVVAVPNGQTRYIGPFSKSVYDQSGADADKIYVDFSGVTSVTCGAFKLSSS